MGKQGAVLWFTGLSGAGKTTTAEYVRDELVKCGRAVELLDGDALRKTISSGLGFSREDRLENDKRIVYVAGLLSKHGVDVLVSAISPYAEMREHARRELPGYIEIYIQCSLQECERRDVKGLYAKARRGEIPSFTGISDVYEEPRNPDIAVDSSRTSLEDNGRAILSRLGVFAEWTI